MLVLTADQVGSRSASDAVDSALAVIDAVGGTRLLRAPERTVGDEVQAATADARCLLDLVLALTKRGEWSVGCGIGAADTELPASIRAARGPAFVAAREAVEAAKKRPLRFALRAPAGRAERARDAEALVDLLLALRSRRTDEGWEVFEHLCAGSTQKAVARKLGISEQAVSLRARAAQVSTELDAVPALVRAIGFVDAADGTTP